MRFSLPARRDVITFAGVFGLLSAVYLLPPDTSLQQVRAAGTLRVCLPPSYPPLVTGDPARPGIDVELLRSVARRLDVRLEVVTNPAMGSDFNPRSWRLTRAQCEVLGGGLVDSETTRSFLQVTPAYAATGWSWLAPRPDAELAGQRVGVLAVASGLDRIALAAWLRAAKARVTITPAMQDLQDQLRAGRLDVGITEHLLAVQMAAPLGWSVGWLPPQVARYRLVFGLWKGDLTLKRAVASAMENMRIDGETPAIIARYIPAGSATQEDARDSGFSRGE